jgi:hypothetical protein
MRGNYSTVAMRKTFEVIAAVDPNLHLVLTMDFDDGFIAWLDGVFLTSVNSPSSPNEPAFNALATASHESSRGDNSAQPVITYDAGPAGTRLGIGSHVLSILGLNSSLSGSSDFIQIADLALVATPTNCLSGLVSADVTVHATDGPISICGNITIGAGATMTIDPGTTVQFAQGAGLTVADGGRLIAEGTGTNRIRFTAAPNSAAWGGFTVNGSVGSPETRISYADFEGNSAAAIHSAGGTVFLDHLNFLSIDHQYVSLDSSSFVVSNCHFPASTKKVEVAHGTGGIKSGGHGVFTRDFFGGTIGYSDAVDFTGGNRPGPIIHFINNVFAGSQDDGIDVDGTDAWIEGNIFLHVHRNGDTPDTSSGVSGGNNSGNTSEVTIIGNLFFDCDNAITAKQGNFFALLNNTIVHMTKTGGIDGASGAVVVRDTTPSPTTFARGLYLENNIIADVPEIVRNYDSAQTTVTLNNNILPMAWTGPGSSNRVADPMFKHVPDVTETFFANWQDAQKLRDGLSLLPGSPAIGNGWEGHDQGGVIPLGVLISAAPQGVVASNTQSSATIRVGYNRTGQGIPSSGWPDGVGYTHYKWRLDAGPWSPETMINAPITLPALASGPHFVEVIGKRDSSWYQDDPIFGDDGVVTRSATWQVGSELRVKDIEQTSSGFKLSFDAMAGVNYSVQYKDFIEVDSWATLTNLPPVAVDTEQSVTDQATARQRFYRVAARP